MRTLRFLLALVCVACLCLCLGPSMTRAQGGDSPEKTAIDLAAKHPALAGVLAARPNWRAMAYDTESRFKIWRVQFWDENWREIGWADVSLERGKVYKVEISNGPEPDDATRKAAEAVLIPFLRAQTELVQLMGGEMWESYTEYSADEGLWRVTFYKAADAVQGVVRFKDAVPFSFRQPELVEIGFPWLAPFGAWFAAQQQKAISMAFVDSRIAEAVRGVDGWKAESTPVEGNQWLVVFKVGEKPLIQAVIDITTGKVIGVQK